METKICRACSVVKTIDQFEKDGSYEHKNGIVKTKYKLDCKECRKGCRTEYLKNYGQTHREELNQYDRERKKEQITCSCGCTLSKGAMSRHKKTQRHINATN